MKTSFHDLQEEAYQKAIESYLNNAKVLGEAVSQNVEQNKEKLMGLLDDLCQGEGSSKTIDEIIFRGQENPWASETETARTKGHINSMSDMAESNFRNKYSKCKSDIVIDKPNGSFLNLMERNYKTMEREVVQFYRMTIIEGITCLERAKKTGNPSIISQIEEKIALFKEESAKRIISAKEQTELSLKFFKTGKTEEYQV